MKRLMIAATLLLAATSMPVWAQAPAANDPQNAPQSTAPAPAQQAAMPMANCSGNSGAMADTQKGCPMAPGDTKSDQGAVPMHQMMHGGMMQGQMHPGGQGAMNCCELSKADKPQ